MFKLETAFACLIVLLIINLPRKLSRVFACIVAILALAGISWAVIHTANIRLSAWRAEREDAAAEREAAWEARREEARRWWKGLSARQRAELKIGVYLNDDYLGDPTVRAAVQKARDFIPEVYAPLTYEEIKAPDDGKLFPPPRPTP